MEFTKPILTFKSSALIRKPGHHSRKRKPHSQAKIKSLEELYASDFLYGLIAGSTTELGFQNSKDLIQQGMWTRMVNAWPSAFVHNVQEGIQRAEREPYAFILDSPMADYQSSKKPCTFYTTAEFLQEQSYAFALRHSHSLRLKQSLNVHIEALQNSGKLQSFYEKWWTSECNKKRDTDFSHIGKVRVRTTTTVNPWRFVTIRDMHSHRSAGNTFCKSYLLFPLCLITMLLLHVL